VVRLRVDAKEGATGIFLPKPRTKQHLLLAPTVTKAEDGLIRVAILNVEGRREKLPARGALGTWIPTTDDMQILSMNGELEEDAPPLKNEDQLDIGEMEAADKDLVVALLRQYADIAEKKTGCPPLATVNVQHHINTGDAAPIMLRRRR